MLGVISGPNVLTVLLAATSVFATPTSLNSKRDTFFTINDNAIDRKGWHWVDTWTAMPQLTESTNLPNPPYVRFVFNTLSSILLLLYLVLTEHDAATPEF